MIVRTPWLTMTEPDRWSVGDVAWVCHGTIERAFGPAGDWEALELRLWVSDEKTEGEHYLMGPGRSISVFSELALRMGKIPGWWLAYQGADDDELELWWGIETRTARRTT